MREKIISILLIICMISNLSMPVMADQNENIISTDSQELYTVGNTSYENGASTPKGNGHDCQQLGIWVPANTTFRIRQTNPSLNQGLTIRMRNDDKQTEASYTIPANGDWIEITPTADSVPFISSIYRADGQKPKVEFSLKDTKELPIYHKGDNEKEFFQKWNALNAPFAVYESDYAIFLVPKCDKYANQIGTLKDLCQYYDNMIKQYNEFSGLSTDTEEVWNKDSGTRYFIKANKHGAGSAYYSPIETATNSSSLAGYMNQNNWGPLHEVGHGYNTIGFNSAEIWNNVYAYYYQISIFGKSTWLGMTEDNRKGYENERQQNGYDGDNYATKLYFWVNVMNKIGPKQASAYSYQKYRYNRYHNIESLNGFTYYADAFTEGTGYNVFPYFELWGRTSGSDFNAAKKKRIQEGVYKNIYPLRSLTQTDESADQIKTSIGLESLYDMIETEQLIKNATLKGTLKIELDDSSYKYLDGHTIKITDGINTVKEITISNKEIDIPLTIGVYNILVDNGSNNTFISNLVGDCVIKENEESIYKITATEINESNFANDTIIFNGYANVKFFTASLDMNEKTIHVITENRQPHIYINGLYTTIRILDKEGNQVYYKEHYGTVAKQDDETFPIEEGYRIQIYHGEPSRLTVCSSVMPNVTISPNVKTSEYEITKYGLQQITPQTTQTAEGTYYKVLSAYMDDLISKNETSDFQNNNKLIEEKIKVNIGYEKLNDDLKNTFLETYKEYFPFNQGYQTAVIQEIEKQKYTGNEIRPNIVVSVNGTQLESQDYTLKYLNNINVGTAKVIVYGKNQYSSVYGEKTFKIYLNVGSEKTFEVISDVDSYEYTGGEKRPSATVKYDGKILRNGIDYQLFHKNNIDVGTGIITATGKGNYVGFYGEGTFHITGQIAELDVSCTPNKIVYNGKNQTVKVNIKNINQTLVEGKDFETKYENNREVGVATVYIKGIGNYIGSTGVGTFEITEPLSIEKSNANTFSNWQIDMNGYGYAGRFSHLTFDIENNVLKVDTKQSTPHSLIKDVYAYITVYDTNGSQVYYKEYYGNQYYSTANDVIPIGLDYIVEVYHREPGRGKVYASQDNSITITMDQTARYKITNIGIQKITQEDSYNIMDIYSKNINKYMDSIIKTNEKTDFKDKTKLIKEKKDIKTGLTLLSDDKLNEFKETYKEYYPFDTYHITYNWDNVDTLHIELPIDNKEYETIEEAQLNKDTTYTENSSIRDENGIWTFSGWTETIDYDSQMINYIGTWTFESYQKAIITYKIENGTWNDQTTEDKTEELILDEENIAKQIPENMIANEGYENGHWNIDPYTTSINGDVIFIYTFDKKEEIQKTIKITYKIVNGTWDGNNREDIIEEIELGKNIVLPTGMISDEGYKDGNWNKTDINVSEDTVYIYTFIKEEPDIPNIDGEKYIKVIYRIKNGSWQDTSKDDKEELVKLKGYPQQVPEGMVADDGYENGRWDIDPYQEITNDIIFTYTYTKKENHKPEISVIKITYKVINGTFNGSDNYLEEFITTESGNVVKATQIPNIIPNEGYELGSWNIDPHIDIKGDIEFIYTCKQNQENKNNTNSNSKKHHHKTEENTSNETTVTTITTYTKNIKQNIKEQSNNNNSIYLNEKNFDNQNNNYEEKAKIEQDNLEIRNEMKPEESINQEENLEELKDQNINHKDDKGKTNNKPDEVQEESKRHIPSFLFIGIGFILIIIFIIKRKME